MPTIISTKAKIASTVIIDESTKNTRTLIADYAVLDDYIKIKHVGGCGDVIIGEGVYLNSFTILYSGNGICIGKNTAIGPNCSLVPVNHAYLRKDIDIHRQGFTESKGGISIGEDVWIGAGVIILDGSKIGKGAVIGAGSLVNGEIEAYSINYGTPCRITGYRR